MSRKKNMTKRCLALGLSLFLAVGTLTGCGSGENSGNSGGQSIESSSVSSEAQSETAPETTPEAAEQSVAVEREAVTIRVGSLKGPTSMGILFLMDKAEKGETTDSYEFQMATGADELLPLMVKGDLDIALVPANVAAVLYQKTNGGVAVVDINTLGVLYMVTGTAEVGSIADLKGKTIYLTGKGTTPEASLRYVLEANGLTEDDYTLEFKSEATEVAAVLAENPDAIGLLPQPFVTAALMQNDVLKVVLDLNEEWMRVENEQKDGISNGMVTGVTVVRKAFLEENPEAVEDFLKEHALSADAINEDVETGAALAVEAGIVAKEPIAQKAIPECNITCVTGESMKADLSAYLNVLAGFNAELVGGQAPADDFYYLGH
ncbi:MAG: ABC transporter substrate-binding protein [Acetatifactor sp.]